MNNKSTDVIVHIDDQIDNDELAEVTAALSRNDGVISFCRNPRTPRFLMVVYNAGRTQSRKILDTITDLGYHATLVGM